jgi:hypothetical protein
MLADLPNESSAPKFPTISISKGIDAVELFILKSLVPFGKAFKPNSRNEEYLNSKLVNHLNKGNSPFVFEKDVIKSTTKRKEDIGVYFKESPQVDELPFYVLEAKRLPTPTGTSRDEREYVVGLKSDGGIERFKKDLHGCKLGRCGMIGYVEEKDFPFWQKKINEWIKDLVKNNPDSEINWEGTEKLSSLTITNTVAHCNSAHSIKESSRSIKLFHFWVLLG